MAEGATAVFLEVLEADLRALCAEARKTDSLATHITGWLQHTDYAQIRECAERALLKLRAIAQERRGVEAVRTKEILRPFLLVCESRNPKLIGAVLGSIQKLVAHDAVSDEGREQIIQALHQVERSSDDTVKLKILQTALTLLQNPGDEENQESAGQVLSLCIRIFCASKASPTVVSTAAATVRQAVALLFDHAMAGFAAAGGGSRGNEGVASGREVAAVLLLQDLLNMCAGSPPTWLQSPLVSRAFVLDLLEFVLLHRPAAFQSHSAFKAVLQNRMGPCLAELSRMALDPEVEPASAGECRLLLRCVGALLRKHVLLLPPEQSITLIETLLAGCGPSRMPWQRLLSLQVLRWLLSDPQLLYALFSSYDMSIYHDTNAVADTLAVALDTLQANLRAADGAGEDLVGSLSALYRSKMDGKDAQIDVEASSTPAQAAAQEVWIAYLSLEVLLAVVAGVETLADAVTVSAGASPEQLQLAPLASSGVERTSSHSNSSGTLLGLARTSSALPSVGTPRTSLAPSGVLIGSRTSIHSPLASSASAALAELGAAGSGGSRRNSSSLGRSLSAMPAVLLQQEPGRQQGQQQQQQQQQHPALSAPTVSTLVDVLWRPLLAGLSGVLVRCRDGGRHEALVLQVLRAYQAYTYSAGALGEVPARDAFLAALCEVAVTPVAAAEEAAATAVAQQHAEAAAVAALQQASGRKPRSSVGSAIAADDLPVCVSSPGGAQAGAGAAAAQQHHHHHQHAQRGGGAPSAAAAALMSPGGLSLGDLGVKNIHALRILFNCAYRLADVLGPSWALVVEVLCVLDRMLPAGGAAPGGAGGPGAKFAEDPSSSSLVSELLIILTVANQLFEASSSMAPDAQVSLMLALSEVSGRTLAAAAQQQQQQPPPPPGAGPAGAPGAAASGAGAAGGVAGAGPGGAGGGAMRLSALSRMVEVLLHNIPRIQDLWGIFLSHLMDALHCGNPAARAAAIEALDRSLTGAIASPLLGLGQQGAAQGQRPQGAASGAAAAAAGGGDVEHMLLVALESMYMEEREPEVRLGLLRVALHVLQRHGDALSRGWVPLLRLLEAVPAWEEASTVSAAFLCVESVSGDFLTTMPKQHIERALEVVSLFAAQKCAINISLSAVGLLWNATDLLGRSRAAAAAAAASAAAAAPASQPSASGALGGALGGLLSILARRPSADEAAAREAAAAAAAAAASTKGARAAQAASGGSTPTMAGSGEAAGYHDAHLAGRSDLTDAECTELLLRLFTHLRKISMDSRPEVRNSGVRTLFLAVSGQAGRFDEPTWRYCLWEVLFPLVTYVHVMGDTSSSKEAAAVELGREKGKVVTMLMHHSRNSEQKQWDETTVLALNGLGKVLRAHLATVLAMPGVDAKWDEVCTIAGKALSSGRKSVAVAAAQLLTGTLQSYRGALAGAGGVVPGGFAWKRTLAAVDEVVLGAMAVPGTRVPLQARTELLNGLSALLSGPGGPEASGLDLQDAQQLLRWLDALARCPVGADDVTPVAGVLPPVQKLVLQVLGHFNSGMLPEAWPDLLRTLAGFLCPFRAMQQRQQQQQQEAAAAAAAAAAGAMPDVTHMPAPPSPSRAAAAAAAAAKAVAPGSPTGLLARGLARLGSGRPALPAAAGPDASSSSVDAVFLTNLWMGKIVERLVGLYSHAPWQVRASLFGAVVGGLGQCAALRHVSSGEDDPLWQQAAAGLVSVANAGLPAVNIMYVNHHQPPENAWQLLAAAFEMFLMGWGLPDHLAAAAEDGAAARAQRQHARRRAERERARETERQREQRQPQAGGGGSSGGRRAARASDGGGGAETTEARLEASVLDSLTDVVLSSCSSAAHDLRARLVHVVAAGAASAAGHACCCAGAGSGGSRAASPWSSPPPSARQSTDGSAALAAAAALAVAAPDAEALAPAPAPPPGSSGAQQQQQQQQEVANGGGQAQRERPRPAVWLCAPAASRFSQMCLRKLSLLAARGTEGSAGSMNAVMLEVAQIALPLLLDRCAVVLDVYAAGEEAAAAAEAEEEVSAGAGADGLAAAAQQRHHQQRERPGLQEQEQRWLEEQERELRQLQHRCLVEEVTCVLQVLVGLRLDEAVLYDALDLQPQVAACLQAAQQAHAYYQQHEPPQHYQHQHESQPPSPVADGGVAKRGSGQALAGGGDAEAAAAAAAADARRQQGHLLLLYGSLARCIGCRDRAVGLLLRQAMLAVGRQLFA